MGLILSKKIYDIKEIPKKKFLIIDKKSEKPYSFICVDNDTIDGYKFLNGSYSNYSANLKRLDFITKDEFIIIKIIIKNILII